MDPPSLERRYEHVSGGAGTRALKYALRRHLNISWAEWITTPWHEQAAYIEGLIHEKLYDPADYEAGGEDGLDSLAGSGYSVGVEYV